MVSFMIKMKVVIKKYWWAFLFILIAPLLVNVILITDTPCPDYTADGSNGWLGFWGAYIGALFPFIILLITIWDTHKENKKDRNIQKATIEYQVSKEHLNTIKKAIADYIQSLNIMELGLIAIRPNINTGDSLNRIWNICQNTVSSFELLEFELVDFDDEKENEYKSFLNKFKIEYEGMIKDFGWVLDFYLYKKSVVDVAKELELYRKNELELVNVYDESKRVWTIVGKDNYNITERGSEILNELLDRLVFKSIYLNSMEFVKYEKEKMDNRLKKASE